MSVQKKPKMTIQYIYFTFCFLLSSSSAVDVNIYDGVVPCRTPGPGQGSEGMTPIAGGGMTPRGTPGLTPGPTPLRDKLNINSEEQLADPAFAKHLVKTQKTSVFGLILFSTVLGQFLFDYTLCGTV